MEPDEVELKQNCERQVLGNIKRGVDVYSERLAGSFICFLGCKAEGRHLEPGRHH